MGQVINITGIHSLLHIWVLSLSLTHTHTHTHTHFIYVLTQTHAHTHSSNLLTHTPRRHRGHIHIAFRFSLPGVTSSFVETVCVALAFSSQFTLQSMFVCVGVHASIHLYTIYVYVRTAVLCCCVCPVRTVCVGTYICIYARTSARICEPLVTPLYKMSA